VILISYALQLSVQADSLQPKTIFQNVIAFGDSYTDNGSQTRFYTDGSNEISPNSLHPSTSDIQRACDGPLWIEYLADMYKANLFDFARSGSTANNNLILRYTEDMHTQVEAYERTNTPRVGSAYFVWTGVNDMTELFIRYPQQRQGRIDIMDAIIDSISDDLYTLADNGANHIVLMGLIPLDAANIYKNISIQTNYELRRLVANYNSRLFDLMSLFQSDNPNISATFFNTHKVFKKLIDGDKSGVLSRMDCQGGNNCRDLIWWDDLHPTTKTHALLATAVYEKLVELQW
ncbi:hypothetical protein INT47_004879, partial [Mucor saturninus]